MPFPTIDGVSEARLAELQAHFDKLTGLGLPEEQAAKSVKAMGERPNQPTTSKTPTSAKCMMKIKDTADMAALTAGLKDYGAAAKKADGAVHMSYSISDGEVHFVEIYDTPEAMDIHIGNCFEHYVKIVPHADMTDIFVVCPAEDLDFWQGSVTAWGASKCVVTAEVA